jgi:hypothetical protein
MSMSEDARKILELLGVVEAERARRAGDATLGATVLELKRYQQLRFSRTYADLLASARYAAAARFFLDELYGPRDFSRRDAQFARVVPGMVRLFPAEIVATVRMLADLHALSETLDTAMAVVIGGAAVSAASYVAAWQEVGRPQDRVRQIDLTLAMGAALDRLTRKPLLRHTLHLMRGPARAAGLADLQMFLESGFDTFKAMGSAAEFLEIVSQRERALADSLFAVPLHVDLDAVSSAASSPLGQLP